MSRGVHTARSVVALWLQPPSFAILDTYRAEIDALCRGVVDRMVVACGAVLEQKHCDGHEIHRLVAESVRLQLAREFGEDVGVLLAKLEGRSAENSEVARACASLIAGGGAALAGCETIKEL